MGKHYIRWSDGSKRIFHAIALFSFIFLFLVKGEAQVKDSTITGIYTDFKSYWSTSTTNISTILPDSSHNLLAFTFRGVTYSTGVNDAVLNTKLGSGNFTSRNFKSLPVSNIEGSVTSGSATYLATAIKNDGDSTKAAYTTPYPVIHIADVLTDGKNGLDLGTGVTNLPVGAHISFAIKKLNAKEATDILPDLVFTQIADPTANKSDTIFFYDVSGNLVGNKKLVNWNTVSKLGTYKLDLYTLSNTTCNASTINGSFQANGTRDIRMVAFLLTEFGITDSIIAAKVKGIQINPNGTSDQAFIAYNTAIVSLEAPVITTQPATQTFCNNSTTSATFSVAASGGGTITYQWKKNGAAILNATSSSYTANSLTLSDTANAYSVTVTNAGGAVTSDNAYVKYVITSHPANQYIATGTTASFTVKASSATGFQWYKDGTAISGATSPTYSIPSVTKSISGTTYYAVVTYASGTCQSNAATLTVEDLPVITTQPQAQFLCSSSVTTATFNVAASAASALSYQWYKNNVAVPGATTVNYNPSGLTFADTLNTYKVTVTSGVGSITSNSVGLKYVILTQPSSLYLATGSTASFSVITSSATAFQWQKGGTAISGATSSAYSKSSIALSDAGSYSVIITHPNGTCTSNSATLTVENLPVINMQPQLQTICNTSTTATFNVAASAASALSYQWYKNNVAVSGATSATYSPTGLTPADTLNAYKVTVTSGVGSVTSNSVGFKYLILTQPVNQYIATGSAATFTVLAPSATGYQWYRNGTAASGATDATYSIPSVPYGFNGSIGYVAVTYAGGTCNSNTVTLTVENLPDITAQPALQVLCNSSVTTATFTVTGSSVSALTYQWYKNGTLISGATASSYTASGLTLADTLNNYSVKLINGVGYTFSNNAGIKYLILSQPAPASAYLATGNTITFAPVVSSVATTFQWKKNGTDITNANALSYTIDTVTTASAGNYTLSVSYTGGSCPTSASVLTTSTVLYSKASGDIRNAANWGVQLNGLGSSPVNFRRAEHTFVIANRDTATLKRNLNVAGTFDVGDGVTTIANGITLEAGRIIRSLTKGSFAGTATSGLIVHGKSDLYFNAANKVLQTLTINTIDTVKLRTALDMTAGSGHGLVKVASGVFSTGDSLTFKSDSLGTASIGNSAGTIIGKTTVERFIPAHRAWRLFCSPVAANGAPTIHAAWQEGAVSSTDNPHPGFGTHITYGAISDGFDQNPQRSFSVKIRNGAGVWVGSIAPLNTTRVTDYPAYMLFIRGNRSYDITTTNTFVTPLPTVMRTTGNLNQGKQVNVVAANGGFTLVGNPYASPIDFASVFLHSQGIANRIRIWNPNMGGTSGVGAYVTVYWDGNSYKSTPNVPNGANLHFIQANEGFFVEGGSNAYVSIDEVDKDSANTLIPFGRLTEENQSKLEVNLRVFNDDKTTGITDGVAYYFNDAFNSQIDGDDVTKLTNMNENLSIVTDNKLLTIEQRTINKSTDSLHLNLSGTKTTSYQLEIIPSNIGNRLYLFDKYLNTTTPVSSSDTSRFTISINASDAFSKAADRFTIVTKSFALLPVSFTKIKADTKEQAIQVNWSIANEGDVRFYEIQKSTNGSNFSIIGEVNATGSKDYVFMDGKPSKGINYYRIKSVSVSGANSYTSIANATFGFGDKSLVAMYPNPVTSNHCTIAFQNKPAGKYVLTFINSAGQTVFTTTLSVTEGNSVHPLVLPKNITKGMYELQVEGAGKKEIIKLITVY